jgi:uncharacterized RDD family membrane protein YckC
VVDDGLRRWWYEQDGQAMGPVSLDEIRSMAENGLLDPATAIKASGPGDWSTAGERAAELGIVFDRGTGPGQRPSPWHEGPATTPAPTAGPGATYSPVTVSLSLAGNGIRFGSFLLELVLLSVTFYVGWLVWSVLVWPRGLTPAKQLTGLRVVDAETGQVATTDKMLVRELVGKIVLQAATLGTIWIVSGFMIIFSDSRQGVWDRIAKTTVVDDAAADVSGATRDDMRSQRTGWVLICLALFAFVVAGFTGQGTESGEQGIAVLMLVVAAGLAVTGIALVVKGASDRRR